MEKFYRRIGGNDFIVYSMSDTTGYVIWNSEHKPSTMGIGTFQTNFVSFDNAENWQELPKEEALEFLKHQIPNPKHWICLEIDSGEEADRDYSSECFTVGKIYCLNGSVIIDDEGDSRLLPNEMHLANEHMLFVPIELENSSDEDEGDIAIESEQVDRGDGGMVSYYAIPDGATELSDLIEHKDMRHGIGEAFCALYRLKDTGDEVRNLKKARLYIDKALRALGEI